MIKHNDRPGKYDAVLGGNNKLPDSAAAFLGGIEGVKKRFNRGNVREKIVAVKQALNYGKAGINIIELALIYDSKQVRQAAE